MTDVVPGGRKGPEDRFELPYMPAAADGGERVVNAGYSRSSGPSQVPQVPRLDMIITHLSSCVTVLTGAAPLSTSGGDSLTNLIRLLPSLLQAN